MSASPRNAAEVTDAVEQKSEGKLEITSGDRRKSTVSRHARLVARTNISVDHEVFEEFSSQAKRKDKTLFAFANESLSAVAKITAEGGDPSDLYRFWSSVALLKRVDVITLPSDFVDELIAKQYASDKEGLLKMFSDLGSQLVGVLKIAAKDLDEVADLAQDFTALLPIKQFKISRTEEGDVLEIGIVGAGRRIESTECSFVFLQSILNGYGYTVTKHETSVGTVRVWASNRKFA